MDAVGGEFNAFTEKEHTCFYATVLDRDLALAVDIVTDVVLNATVTAQDVDVERGVVLEEIAMRDDDPGDLVHDEFATALFGDAPLGRPILGTEESIRTLTRRQVHGYYRRRYTPDAMVVSVAGNVEHAEVVRLVRRAFAGRLDPARRRAAARRAGRATDRAGPAQPVAVVPDDTEQANLVLGCHGLSRHDPRRYALGVLSSALGGGMSSRLFQRVREERGLAYSVYSFSQRLRRRRPVRRLRRLPAGQGRRGAVADARRARRRRAPATLTADEIERGKGQMRGAIVLGLEDAGSRMTRIGKSEIAYGDILGVDEVLARDRRGDRRPTSPRSPPTCSAGRAA